MDPVSLFGGGLSLLNGVSGLLGASAARKRAMEARDNAVQSLLRANDTEYNDARANGNLALAKYAGSANTALTSTGNALGEALARAGIGGSSATAAALQKQAGVNSSNMADIIQNLVSTLSTIRAHGQQNAANLQAGLAMQDLQNANAGESGAKQNFANLVGLIPSLFPATKQFPTLPGATQNAVTQGVNTAANAVAANAAAGMMPGMMLPFNPFVMPANGLRNMLNTGRTGNLNGQQGGTPYTLGG